MRRGPKTIYCVDDYTCVEKPVLRNYCPPNRYAVTTKFVSFDKQFYQSFYYIYVCNNNHVTYLCKRCAVLRSCRRVDQHIYLHDERFDVMNSYCIYVSINKGRVVKLNSVDLFQHVPALCCFDLKYDEILRDYLSNTNEDFIDDKSDIFPGIIKIIKQQHVYCPFCKSPFDSFPSIIMIVGHFADCIAKPAEMN